MGRPQREREGQDDWTELSRTLPLRKCLLSPSRKDSQSGLGEARPKQLSVLLAGSADLSVGLSLVRLHSPDGKVKNVTVPPARKAHFSKGSTHIYTHTHACDTGVDGKEAGLR